MDASQYKNYALTLLFMKYVSGNYAGGLDAVIGPKLTQVHESWGKGARFSMTGLRYLVGERGFEPPTPWSRT